VAAGLLTEAVSNREFIDVPVSLLKPGVNYFALKVRGNSMIEDCILDGDTVVIRKQSNANNGQIVVALVNNDATIKRYYKKKNRIELHPANPSFDVIIVDPAAEFKILGVLASVIRQCD
jgi:repressor LexA